MTTLQVGNFPWCFNIPGSQVVLKYSTRRLRLVYVRVCAPHFPSPLLFLPPLSFSFPFLKNMEGKNFQLLSGNLLSRVYTLSMIPEPPSLAIVHFDAFCNIGILSSLLRHADRFKYNSQIKPFYTELLKRNWQNQFLLPIPGHKSSKPLTDSTISTTEPFEPSIIHPLREQHNLY